MSKWPSKKEIRDLLDKKLTRKSYSPWRCLAFCVSKISKLKEESQG